MTDMVKVVLFEWIEPEYDMGYEARDLILNKYQHTVDEVGDTLMITEEEFQELEIGIERHNARNSRKLSMIRIVDVDNSNDKVTLDKLFEVGRAELKARAERSRKAKERAAKTKATRELKKIEKLAKELGCSHDEVKALLKKNSKK